jgi:hypothetical protein
MAQNFASFEAFSTRHQAQPIYSGEFSNTFSSTLDPAQSPIHSQTDIPFLLDQRPGSDWVVEVVGYVETDDGTRAAVGAIAGVHGWFIDGAYVDNGTFAAIDPLSSLGIGRSTPQYRLAFSGAARTAILALSGDPESITLEVRYRPARRFSGYWQGYQSFGRFVDIPPNAIPVNQNANVSDMEQAIDSLLAGPFQLTGPRYNVAAPGEVPSYVPSCSFAAIDCTGYVVIQSSDIGNAVGQIPVSVADNTAGRFYYHPNTFFRSQNDKINGLAVRQGDRTSVSATQLGQPIGIYVNDDIIDESNWLIIVDGAPQIVHMIQDSSLGSPRTPRQIWEMVWNPLLSGSESTARSVEINASVKLNKLGFLSYARYLDRPGTTYIQTNTTPPG